MGKRQRCIRLVRRRFADLVGWTVVDALVWVGKPGEEGVEENAGRARRAANECRPVKPSKA